MAKNATKTKEAEAAPEAPKPEAPTPTFRVGNFEFKVETGLPIPKVIPKAANANELPFKDWFGKMAHNDHVFIPHAYWTAPQTEGGRGVDMAAKKESLDTFARTKIRGSFRQWQGKADPQGSRDDRDIILVPRKKGDAMGDKGDTFPEAGMSLFMVFKQAG